MGNHDDRSANSATQNGVYYGTSSTLPTGWRGRAAMPSGTEAYYSFDYGNIHFVVLDSHDSDRSVGSSMLTWLEQDLAATTQDWIIAFWHHPPYSKGGHDSDLELRLVEMRENVVPILDDYGVDLTLTGHSHDYERSFLLDGHYGDSSTLLPSMKVDGGDGREDGDGAYHKPVLGPDPHSGTVHTVSGTSGRLNCGPLDHPAIYIAHCMLGSFVLDIDDQRLDAKFLDDGGQVQDYYTILKGCIEDPDDDEVCNGADNCPDDPNPGQEDADSDGAGDACDPCPDDPDDDIDGDGLCGDVDNCPSIPNVPQADGDSDGVGDICDICPVDPDNDQDADGVCGEVDNCPAAANAGQADSDLDGAGDACDNCPLDPMDDIDGDGVCGDVDNCPVVPNPSQADSDSDGIGDACDANDNDNDGVSNMMDCAPDSSGVSSIPQPIGATLTLDKTSGGTLAWARSPQGHTTNVYRGLQDTSLPFSLGPVCFDPENPTTQSIDSQPVSTGTLLYYLLTARNMCGGQWRRARQRGCRAFGDLAMSRSDQGQRLRRCAGPRGQLPGGRQRGSVGHRSGFRRRRLRQLPGRSQSDAVRPQRRWQGRPVRGSRRRLRWRAGLHRQLPGHVQRHPGRHGRRRRRRRV